MAKKKGGLILGAIACLLLPVSEAGAIAPLTPHFPSGPQQTLLTQDNLFPLQVEMEQEFLGTMDAYQYADGFLLPLRDLANKLGFTIVIDRDSSTASGWFIDPSRQFSLSVAEHWFSSEDDSHHSFAPNLAHRQNGEIYVDSSLISRIWPIDINIDPTIAAMEVIPHEQLEPATATTQAPPPLITEDEYEIIQAEEIPEDMAEELLKEIGLPPELPPTPAPISSSESGRGPAQTPLPEAKEDQTVASDYLAQRNRHDDEGYFIQNDKLEPVDAPEFGDTNLLIVDPRLGRRPAGSIMEVYQHPKGYYLPLGELARILEFPITVSPAEGHAEGWFIRENRTFRLDIPSQTIDVEGDESRYPDGLVIATDHDIYVDSALLSSWIPINFNLLISTLNLQIDPRELLPQEERRKRQLAWKTRANLDKDISRYPLIEENPHPLGPPLMDVNINNSIRNKSDPLMATDYSVRNSMEIARMTTETYISGGSTGKGVDHLRFKAGRDDRQGNLLGNMHATSFYMGDINSYTLPLVTQSSLGRGIQVTNVPLNRPTSFDQTDFIGESTPGWEVELYLNGSLLDFQVVGEDGRYQFIGVPIYYGTNTFRIISYGPQGQVEEEVQRFLITDTLLRPGEINYELSLDQKSERLLPFIEDTDYNHPRGVRAVGEIEYGLGEHLTAGVGFAHTPLENSGRHSFLSGSLRGEVAGILLGGQTAYDVDSDEYAGRITALTRIGTLNVKAEHSHFSDGFSSEQENVGLPTLQLTDRSLFDINRSFNISGLPSFSTGLSAEHSTYLDGSEDSELRYRLATTLFGLQFSNTLRWNDNDNATTAQPEMGGVFAVRGYHDRLLMRAALDYDIAQEQELNHVNLSLQRAFGQRGTVRGAIKKGFNSQNDELELNSSVSWNFDRFRLSGQVQADENSNVYIGTNLSFALGYQPKLNQWFMSNRQMAKSGAVSIRSFLDENNNGVYDENEPPLSGIPFSRTNIPEYTDENGYLMLAGIRPHRPADVFLDRDLLKDTTLRPMRDGYSVVTRPGQIIHLDFPITGTADITGNVLLTSPVSKKALGGLKVELLNENGKIIRAAISEFDGFYILEGVPPGHYYLAVNEDQLEEKNYIANYHEINIGVDGDDLPNYDFSVETFNGDFTYPSLEQSTKTP